MSNIAWTILKMLYMGLMVCLERDTQKFSDALRPMGGWGRFKREAYFNMFILQLM